MKWGKIHVFRNAVLLPKEGGTGLEIKNFQLSGHNPERSEAYRPSEAREESSCFWGAVSPPPLQRGFEIFPKECHSGALFWTYFGHLTSSEDWAH